MAHEDLEDLPQGMALTELALSVELARTHTTRAEQFASALLFDLTLAGLDAEHVDDVPEVIEELGVVVESLKDLRSSAFRAVRYTQGIITQAEELRAPEKIDIYSESVDPLVAEYVRGRVGQRITFEAIADYLEHEGIVIPDDVEDSEELFAIWRDEVASTLEAEGFVEAQGAVRAKWEKFAFDGRNKRKDWTYLLHLTGVKSTKHASMLSGQIGASLAEPHTALPDELREAVEGVLSTGPMRLNTLRNMLLAEGQSKEAADALLSGIVEQGFAYTFVEAGRTHLTLDPTEAQRRHVERRGHNRNNEQAKERHEFQPDIAAKVLLILRGVLSERGSAALASVKILEALREENDDTSLREIPKAAISGLANRLVELGLVERGLIGRQGKGFDKSTKVLKYWLSEKGRALLADVNPTELPKLLEQLQAQNQSD